MDCAEPTPGRGEDTKPKGPGENAKVPVFVDLPEVVTGSPTEVTPGPDTPPGVGQPYPDMPSDV